MKFEEWCNSIGMEETRVVECDLVSMTTLKECWDYQQEKVSTWKQRYLDLYDQGYPRMLARNRVLRNAITDIYGLHMTTPTSKTIFIDTMKICLEAKEECARIKEDGQ